jgi:glycosyltransferase involved in cell wall biosynthesis
VPKISILLPLYNVERYVADCLHSLLVQSRNDFEIIAVDDASPDRSGPLVRTILGAQDRIPWKFILNDVNKGLAETRRIAAAVAGGDYVLCVDSDDRVHPDLIETILREADLTGADVVIFAATCVDPDGSLKYVIETGDEVMTGVQAVEKIMELSLQAYCWNKLVRRSIFDAVHHPCGLIYEDFCVSVQTLGHAGIVRLIPDRLYFYVVRDSGISTRFNPRVTDLFEIMDLVEHETESLPIRNYPRLIFRLRYIYGFRTIAFQAAERAPDFNQARPILDSVAQRLRLSHIGRIFADHRPRLSVAMLLLKLHPWLFYHFARAFNHR